MSGWAAWSLAGLALLIEVAQDLLDAANGHQIAPPVAGSVVGLSFVIVGALIASRRPRNPIGWIYLVGILLIEIGGFRNFADQYALYTRSTNPGAFPGAEWVSWFAGPALGIGFFGLLTLPLLLFPDGRLPSRRWVPLAALFAVVAVIQAVMTALQPGPLRAPVELLNPLGVSWLGSVAEFSSGPLGLVSVLLGLGCLAAPFVRLRRATGQERQQLAWFAYGAGWVIVVAVFGISLNLVAGPTTMTAVGANLWPLSILGLPIATAIAILRHRLYDIDVLIRRTVVYGATTVALAALFFSGVLLIQALLRPFTQGNELAVAASTLASLALFQPLRRRVQSLVDRRFYRSRYDAVRTLDQFADRLRDEVDLEAVRASLLGAVGRTVQPTHASVWLRRADR